MDNIWSKARNDSQFQLKDVQDWAFYLKHFESILHKFANTGLKKKFYLIYAFQNGLWLLIKA